MERRALDVTPPMAKSPCLSPGTYFGVNELVYARAAEHVEMAAPHPELLQNYVPPSVYQHRQVPQNVASYTRAPDARPRKLNIRPSDEKELKPRSRERFHFMGKNCPTKIFC